MKTSLTTGEWGSFTTPRSRALGGKSGITRAKPLVLIFPLHFAYCFHAAFLALLSAFLAYASLPPDGPLRLLPVIQEQPCLIEQQVPFEQPERWIEQEACKPPT